MWPTHPRPDLLLVCDCDGVLIESEAVVGDVLVDELQRCWPGADVRPVVTPLLGRRIVEVLQITASMVGKPLPADAIQAIRRRALDAAIRAPMVDGIHEALSQIPLHKACASNSVFSYVTEVLRRTGLSGTFGDRVFTGDMVSRPKPAPDVYLLAARSSKVAPSRCLVIEDSVAGASAALAAGMTVFAYAGLAHDHQVQGLRLREAGVHQTFHDMKQLPDLVQRWVKEVGAVPMKRSIE
ncbi:HAD-IA family hydrolase [Aquincola sp. S2]|uniref:HAD-IA family hydrolase n=1 Tax=Pseudaquabacterium terrae TaxID=2732868 RepID=A0ABX2EU63_9BURK|nr:HAD-IA family hydrolase [Aquabacterium terrae]NRF72074.1 HAD-IA family hydrolase [Aquabacterium terrae]